MLQSDWVGKSWFTGAGACHDFDSVLQAVSENKKEYELHVGADSHLVGEKYMLAVAICLYKPASGGNYFFSRKSMSPKKYSSLGLRLHSEAYAAVEVAALIHKRIDENLKITVHVDISPNPAHKSSKHLKGICSFIQALGYEFRIKPDAWASSSVADSHAK